MGRGILFSLYVHFTWQFLWPGCRIILVPHASFWVSCEVPSPSSAHSNKPGENIRTIHNLYYKITKIVRALWLPERRVCMRICKHGCDVKFCFSRANHASTNLKNVFELKTLQASFIHPFPRRLKLGKPLQNMLCQFFFRISWHFKREKSVFWKASFLQNKNIWLPVQYFPPLTGQVDWQESSDRGSSIQVPETVWQVQKSTND